MSLECLIVAKRLWQDTLSSMIGSHSDITIHTRISGFASVTPHS